MGKFTIGTISFCSFFPVFKGAVIFMAMEIIPVMEVTAFPMFLMVVGPMEPILPFFFPCRCRLGLFDGQCNFAAVINGNNFDFDLILYLKIIINIIHKFICHF